MDSLISTFDTDRESLERQLGLALRGCDDGELFMEYTQSEGLMFDNGKLKSGNFNTEQGFGLRAVAGEVISLCPFGRNDPCQPETGIGCGRGGFRRTFRHLRGRTKSHKPASIFRR